MPNLKYANKNLLKLADDCYPKQGEGLPLSLNADAASSSTVKTSIRIFEVIY